MMACTRKGLSRFILQGTDSDIKKVVSYGVDLKNSHSLSNNFLACIDKQNDSIYWVGTLGGGLNRLVIQGRYGQCLYCNVLYDTGWYDEQ